MIERENDTIWDFYIEVLEGLWSDGRDDDAQAMVAGALQEAECFGALDPLFIDVVKRQVDQYVADERYESARRIYLLILETQVKVFGQHHSAVGVTLSEISEIQQLSGASQEHTVRHAS